MQLQTLSLILLLQFEGNMINNVKKIIAGGALVFPVFGFAATFKDAVASVVNVSGLLIPLLFSFALAWFIWGIVDFIRAADNPEQRKKGKQRILWGILAITVMVGYLGFTSIFTQTFFNQGTSILPQLFE